MSHLGYRLGDGRRLAVAMGLHSRLGAESPLSVLDNGVLAGLHEQLGCAPCGYPHRPAEAGEEVGSCRNRTLADSRREAIGARIAVDITFYSSQIQKNLLQQHGVCCHLGPSSKNTA